MNEPGKWSARLERLLVSMSGIAIGVAAYYGLNYFGVSQFWQWTAILGVIAILFGYHFIRISYLIIRNARRAFYRAQQEADDSEYYQARKKLQEEAAKRASAGIPPAVSEQIQSNLDKHTQP